MSGLFNVNKLVKIGKPIEASNISASAGSYAVNFGIGKNGTTGDISFLGDAGSIIGLTNKSSVVFNKVNWQNAVIKADSSAKSDSEVTFLDNITKKIVSGIESLVEHLFKNNEYSQPKALLALFGNEPDITQLNNYEICRGQRFGAISHVENVLGLSWAYCKELFVKKFSSDKTIETAEDEFATYCALAKEALVSKTAVEDLDEDLKYFLINFLQVLAVSKTETSAVKFYEKMNGVYSQIKEEDGFAIFGKHAFLEDGVTPTSENLYVTKTKRVIVGYYTDKHSLVGKERTEAFVAKDLTGKTLLDKNEHLADYAEGSIIATGQVALLTIYDAGEVIERKQARGLHKDLDYPTPKEVSEMETENFFKYEAPTYNGYILTGESGSTLKCSSAEAGKMARKLVIGTEELLDYNVQYTVISTPSKTQTGEIWYLVPQVAPLVKKARLKD